MCWCTEQTTTGGSKLLLKNRARDVSNSLIMYMCCTCVVHVYLPSLAFRINLPMFLLLFSGEEEGDDGRGKAEPS